MPNSEKKNTFKFQNFSELIEVDILIKKRAKLDPKEESHLAECFDKWTSMNCSLEFIELRNALAPKIFTLDLLLVNEEEVVNILFDNIEKCTNLSVTAVLDLLQSLVCDIREDFLPYLEKSFSLIIGVIERSENDAEMLLSAFNCIAHILCFLERPLIKNLNQLFPLIKPLLFHKSKHYIRHFSAQSLAYLLRRSRDFKSVFSKEILTDLLDGNTGNIYSDSIGHLMASCLKVKDSILSSASKIFVPFYEILIERQDEFFVNCFEEMFRVLLKNLTVVSCRDLWRMIVDQILIKTEIEAPDELSLLVMELFFKYAANKSLAQCANSIIGHVKQLISTDENSSDKLMEIVKLIVNKLPTSSDIHDLIRQFVLSNHPMEIESKFQLVEQYINNTQLEIILKNSLNNYLSSVINESWLSSDSNNLHRLMKCMIKLVLKKYPISQEARWSENIGHDGVNFNMFFIEDPKDSLVESVLKIIDKEEECEEIFWMITVVLPYFHPANVDSRILESLKNKLKSILQLEITPEVLVKIHSILDCITHLTKIQALDLQIDIDINSFIGLLNQYDFSSSLEPLLLEIIFKSISMEKDAETLSNHKSLFLDKLKSPHHQSRLNSIRILQKIFHSDGTVENSLRILEEIEKLFELHETELVKKERTIINLMNGISFCPGMSKFSKEIIVNFLLGAMHIQLSSLWKFLKKTFCSFYLENKNLTREEQLENEIIIWSNIEGQLQFCSGHLVDGNIDYENQIAFSGDFHREYLLEKFYKSRSANWLQFRLNIIRLLWEIPELAAKKTAVLSPLLLGIYRDEFSINKSPRKIREETLISLLTLFSKFPNISCSFNEKSLKNLYYKCLTSRLQSLQLAAFSVLVNYKIPELQQYKIEITEFLNDNKDELKQISLSVIQPGHRQVILPIMLRIIVGKLKSINKTKKKNPLISYLLELKEEEIGRLMSILLEGLKITEDKCEIVQDNEDIRLISSNIRKSIESGTTPQFVIQAFFKTLQGVCVSIKMILKNLLNKLSNQNLSMILKVILDFYACCNHVKRNLSIDCVIPQLKPLRQECAKMVLFYFSKIESFVWNDELLSEITGLMVYPNIDKLVEQNQSSVNITIQLCALWSQKEEMVALITPDVFSCLIELIGKPKLNREKVGYELVNIIYNIMQHAVTGGRKQEQRDCLQTMIISHLPAIIQYLGQKVRSMKLKKLSKENTEMTVTRKELSMITICVDYIIKTKQVTVDEQNILDMINNMLIFLYRSNALILATSGGREVTENDSSEVKEQLEVDFLHAIESLANIVDTQNILTYFERFLGLFSRLRKRASRMVLSIFISKLWPRISSVLNVAAEFSDLGQIAIKLNSWDEKRLEEMDSEMISKTIEYVLEIIKKKPIKDCCIEEKNELQSSNLHPNLWMYNLTCQNCLFILSDVAEIGTRQIAQDYLDNVIQSIADCDNDKVLQVMFYDNIWPALKYGISSKNESYRYAFIGVIKTVVLKLGHTERFRDIANLATSESNKLSFFENMLSLTTAFNSKGLRQLVKFLSKNLVSPQNLKEILLPLVWHRIELVSQKYHANDKTTLTNAHRESLISSFEALSAVSKQLPMELYNKLISEQMVKLEKGFNVELILKILIALLNGYNSDQDKEDHSFMIDILHKLEKHLSKRTSAEIRHKHAQKSTATDLMNPKDAEWTIRGMALQVPIALAIINIVVRLPKKYIKEIITKVILRICDFLKAKEVEVRKEAGTTMFKILEILNSSEFVKEGNVKYLGFCIQTVKNNLDRGFQRHVGLYTCHRIMQKLQQSEIFNRLTIDYSTIKNMSQLYLDELFGSMAKEKSERATAEKGIVQEAKNVKAFEGFLLLAKILEKNHVFDFFQLLINTIKEFRSQSDLHKFQKIFESIQSKGGLLKNRRLDPISLFSLSVLLISEHMESLFSSEKDSKIVIKSNVKKSTFEDLHLYKKATRLDDDQAPLEINIRSSSHLIINCGLNLLHGLTKLYRSSPEINLASMLDPALEYIIKILDNVQYKIIMLSGIKCLKEIIQINPSSLSNKIEEVSNLLFRIHDKYSLVSDVRDNFGEHLSNVVNKTLTQFIQRPDVHLNSSQYKVLLLSVHVDSLNSKRQMTSFNLLKAIIENRIKEPAKNEKIIVLTDDIQVQLIDIIEKVKVTALDSPNEKTRSDARATIAAYLKCYKQSEKFLQDIILYNLKQMITLPEDGKLSACLVIQNILKQFSSKDIDVERISHYFIACIITTILNGVTEKVEEVLRILIHQTMDSVNTDKHNDLCNMVFEYFPKYQTEDKRFGISFFMMSTMLKSVRSEARESFSLKFIKICMEKLPLLLECSNKLSDQLIAAKGEDSDLMTHLENETNLKKRKICETNDNAVFLENSSELSNKKLHTLDNINRVLSALSSLIDISENQTDIAILNETVQLGLANNIWKLIVEEIMRNKHSSLRLNASKNIVYKLLTLEHKYKTCGDLTFGTEEMIHATIVSSFNQLKNEQLTLDECNSVLLNIVLLWEIVIENFTDEVKLEMCRKMINLANHVANDELINGTSLIKRCAILKFLASICLKTKLEDIERFKLERNILWMWMREERQSQDESDSNKKKSVKRHHKTINRYCSFQEILDWKNLVVEVGDHIKCRLGEEKCKILSINIRKEKAAEKLKRKIADSALAVSNPGEALRKKIKKSKKTV